MGKLIPFLFIALDGKSAVAHLRLRIPGHKLRYMQFVNVGAQRSPGRMPVYFWRHSLWIAGRIALTRLTEQKD